LQGRDSLPEHVQRATVVPQLEVDGAQAGLVLAIARPWKTAQEQTITNLVAHVPPTSYQRPRGPREQARQSRTTFWTFHTRLCLRHIGDVTVLLSKRGRNRGPTQTKILVTTLAELTASQVGCISHQRWAIERLNWELKSGLGLGEHQVSGDQNRSEKSVGIAVLAYVVVLRVCHHEIIPGTPWSSFQLQHALRLRVMTNPVEHKVTVTMAKTRKAA
jgi:Transposase DDE domain